MSNGSSKPSDLHRNMISGRGSVESRNMDVAIWLADHDNT